MLRTAVACAAIAGTAVGLGYGPAVARGVLTVRTTIEATDFNAEVQAMGRAWRGESVVSQPGCDTIDGALAAIKAIESGGDYSTSPRADSGAAGAYQFLPETWEHYGGTVYAPTADRATPAQQDTVARALAVDIVARHGSVSDVPAYWFAGVNYTGPMTDELGYDGVTPQEYVARWRAACAGAVGEVDEAGLVLLGQGGHKLRPDAAVAFKAWEREYGGEIPITDSYRSWALQEQRHNEEPGRFVPPGASAHVTGNAVDVNLYEVDEARLVAAARAAGWCQSAVNNGEPWHFSYGECK